MHGIAAPPFVQPVQWEGGVAGDVGFAAEEPFGRAVDVGLQAEHELWPLIGVLYVRVRCQMVIPAVGVEVVTDSVRPVAQAVGMGGREIDRSQHVGIEASGAPHAQAQAVSYDLSFLQVCDVAAPTATMRALRRVFRSTCCGCTGEPSEKR